MKLALATSLLVALCAAPAFADCTYPTNRPTKIPNASTALKEEMLEAQKAVRQYKADMEAYMACIQLERGDMIAKEGGEQISEDKKKQLDGIYERKYNAALDELLSVTDPFNAQVREFSKLHPSKSK